MITVRKKYKIKSKLIKLNYHQKGGSYGLKIAVDDEKETVFISQMEYKQVEINFASSVF